MPLEATKIECLFQLVDDDLSQLSPAYSGLFHLFEHQYDANTFFWYGVGEINCEYNDMNPTDGSNSDNLLIQLRDGRRGLCRRLNSAFQLDEVSEHMTVALVGVTKLSR